ncbi:MAG: sugar phosphate nucleotidyltransferase [Candidatus Woesearchaeota archaeon]
MKNKISITINEKTLKEIDSIIDNIYIRNRSQAIELLVSNALGENKTTVILSGGNEENIKISDKEYRITAKIKDFYLIEHIIKKLKEYNFKKIFLIAKEKIINSVFSIVQNGQKFGVSIEYIEEKDSLGTFHTLSLVKGRIKTNFLVIYGDIYFNDLNLDKLWDEHIKRKGIATLLLTTTKEPEKKGIIKIEGSKILEFIQKPEKSDIYLGFSSVFVAQPEILEYNGKSLEEDVFPFLAKKGLLNGYLSTSKITKIRNKKDIEKIIAL